jgi:hypothetical protein
MELANWAQDSSHKIATVARYILRICTSHCAKALHKNSGHIGSTLLNAAGDILRSEQRKCISGNSTVDQGTIDKSYRGEEQKV